MVSSVVACGLHPTTVASTIAEACTIALHDHIAQDKIGIAQKKPAPLSLARTGPIRIACRDGDAIQHSVCADTVGSNDM